MKQTTEDTKPRTFVFVLMPFSEESKDIYEVGIKAACQAAGAYCERVDEQIFDGSILSRIYNQIAKADVVVADMTERNANVFYETGYAHALNKRVILLTQDADDIPFDLKDQPHIVYSGGGKIASLKSKLESRIRWCIENPLGSLRLADPELQIFVNGVPLESKPTIEVQMEGLAKLSGGSFAFFTLSVDIHSVTNLVLIPDAFNLALILPDVFGAQVSGSEGLDVRSMTRLPDGRQILNIRPLAPLFPQGWDTVKIQITGRLMAESLPEMMIRVFTEVGPRDYPFIVKPKTEKQDEVP